jgi:uncharacterized metal-binding protein YceD (DUF177 family)
MNDKCKIYIDRLTQGNVEQIEESLSPEFLDVEEADLSFQKNVFIRGEAYLTGEHLVLKLKIEAKALIPCAICNEMVETPINIEKFYHTKELRAIPSHVYDFTKELREAILLEVPSFVECRGNCPERAKLKKYFYKERREKENNPFSEL